MTSLGEYALGPGVVLAGPDLLSDMSLLKLKSLVFSFGLGNFLGHSSSLPFFAVKCVSSAWASNRLHGCLFN